MYELDRLDHNVPWSGNPDRPGVPDRGPTGSIIVLLESQIITKP
jgi:hypothetical protein